MLREHGVRLAIDDFGTGHSSLGRLRELPVSTLKIDRSFVADLPDDRGAAAIVVAIIQLAHSLGVQPLAEGIETQEQLDFLLEHGCELGQGYLLGRPVPADELVAGRLSRAQRAVAPTVAARASGLREPASRRTTRAPAAEAAAAVSHMAS